MSRTEPLLALATLLVISSNALSQQDTYQPAIPRDAVVQMERGRDLRRQGKTKEAVDVLRAVAQAQPSYYLAQYNLGIALSDAKDFAGSAMAFDAAVSLKEKNQIPDPTVYNSAGWAYLLAGDYKKAEVLLLKAKANAAQLSPESRQRLNNNLGLLYLYTGDLKKSEMHLQSASRDGSKLATENLKLLDSARAAQTQASPRNRN